ncbi:MAG TPA: DUF2341 domain-containing protein [Burkholderiales bacterium]|nr:DUF2341 domain-containing protein [Burkholderiales bacterium]
MNLKRLASLLFAVLAVLGCAGAALAQSVTVIPATGGGAISADNVGGAWTTLTGPELDETRNGGSGSIEAGTIVLNAPAGFEFDTLSTVTVTVGRVSGNTNINNWINLGAGRGQPANASVAATTITITVTQISASNTHNSLTWSGIQVRPTAHCPLSSGDIGESGTSPVALSSTNLGTLQEVVGATSMYTVLPGQSFTACSGISGPPSSQTAGVAFDLTSLVVADQWGNVDSGYAGTHAISYSGPTGANSYTTSVAFAGGISTTTLATTINTAQTATITATDGAVPGVASASFTVGASTSCTTPPWYNAAWLYRKAITIDHTKVGGALSNYPVLVSITDSNLQSSAQASGNDILFTDSSGTTKLAHEIEQYSSATGQLIAWVNVPSVSVTADTVIYMYYGNASAPAQQNPSAVWDANFRGVWHLKEVGSNASGGYKDSTSLGNNGTGGAGTSAYVPTQVAGKIGYGQQFSGGQLIYGTTSSMPNVNGDQTMSFWYEVTSNSTSRANFFVLRTAGGGSANQGVFVGPISGSCSAYAAPLGMTQWGGTCSIDTNAPATGAWHYFVFTRSGTTNTLYIDGAQVATNTAALQTGAIGEFLWGSYDTTPSEPLTGLMDETRVSNVARSAAWIQTDYNSQNSPSTFLSVGAQQVDACYTHYAISFPSGSTGVTCDVSQVTITAHDATHTPTSPPAGTVLNISTSTGAGVWTNLVAGAGTLSGYGANNGAASYTWGGGENSITLDLRQNTPATINVNLIDSNGKMENSGTEDPSISFADSAFRVTADGSTAASIGTQIAGKSSNFGFGAQTLYLQAIRTDTNTGSCVGLIQNQTVGVDLAASCINPASCAAIGSTSMQVLNSGGSMVSIPKNNGPAAPTSYQNVSLAFNAASEAPLVLNYADAGSVQLYAQYALPSPPSGSTVSGSSNVFVVRPFGLRISGPPSGRTGAGSTVFATAAQSFPVSVAGVQWQAGDDANADGVPDSDAQIVSNAVTPNFGQESPPATVTLSSTLAEPAGGDPGTLTVGPFSAFGSGTTSANVSWSEVGLMNLSARSANYLAGGGDVTNSATGLTGVGRFVPAWFYLQPGASLTNRQALACSPASTFSYMGEGMGLGFTLTAQNSASQTTQNYTGSFAKLNPALASSFAFGAKSGATNLTGRLSTSAVSGSWANGQAAVQATVAIGRNNSGPNPQDFPDGPYSGVNFGIAPVDSDGVAMNTLDLNVGGGGNDHKNLGVSTEVRYGQLRCYNALGAVQLPLPMPMLAQYWNGGAFVTNGADSCTPIAAGNVVYGSYRLNLTAGEVGPPTITQIAGGSGQLLLPKPSGGSGNYTGSMSVTLDVSGAGMDYLLGNWSPADPDANPATAYDDDPMCTASFGLYGSQPNQFTFQRENY